jgi:hypothetical protein
MTGPVNGRTESLSQETVEAGRSHLGPVPGSVNVDDVTRLQVVQLSQREIVPCSETGSDKKPRGTGR